MELQDKIGRKLFVDKICNLVDSLQTDRNFCLSINGEWGSGKSFVLGMIERQLSDEQGNIIIKYDAWKNNFYSDPLISILYCILETLDNISIAVKIKRATTVARKYIKQEFSATVDFLAENNKIFNVIVKVVRGIRKIIKEYKNTSLTENKRFDDYKSYSKLLQETIDLMNMVTTCEMPDEKRMRLIVLVDELDRCLPNEQLIVLERLHHLFNVKNCVAIVALNQQSISQTVQNVFGSDGNKYLRKFFDFTFKLEMSAAQYLKSLMIDFENNFGNFALITPEISTAIELAYHCLVYRVKIADNRELTRYYDCLLRICASFGWKRITAHYAFFIIVGLYIRRHVSVLFLNETNMSQLQHVANPANTFRHFMIGESDSDMPFYDYLSNLLKIDRKWSPTDIKQEYNSHTYSVNYFSWCFSEIVYYSTQKQFDYNEIRIQNHQPTINCGDCQELCRLIRLYGGENATNER